ncbi:MAG: ADP-ribosylglycohydrolase family protein, partial [Planctomycetaceae bacterium]|nr:ADP-ribosylglycohydrolase family protein [Planctomycetaceae bacterium]
MIARVAICLLLASGTIATAAEPPAVRRLPVKVYRDKMQGAWLGQMVGVGWGQPTEFHWMGEIIPKDKMPAWQPEWVNQHANDDCYVEMTFVKTLEDYGFDVSMRQASLDFANSGYGLCHANLFGRNNLRRGIAGPDSGHPKFTQHSDDIDYQIEADFAGIISPGMPNQANELGWLFGHLMNYGDGVYAGQFIAAMYTEAYFQSDVQQLIKNALKAIPAESQYAEMVRDVLRWHEENPNWEKTWQLVEDKYHKDPHYTHGLCCKAGGKGVFSIDVKVNGAYVLMGLLYGNRDIEQTIAIACRCGQDSDCNPSNAAGILFTV